MAEARNKLVCGADSIFKDPSKAAAFAANLKSARFSDEAFRKLPGLEQYRASLHRGRRHCGQCRGAGAGGEFMQLVAI